MGSEDEDGGGGDSLGVGLKVMLSAAFSLFGMVILIIILHFFAKYLIRRQQRRRHNDALYQVSSQIAPIDASYVESPNSGLDPLVIASLPKLLYKQSDQFSHGEVMECSVCLGTVVEDSTIRVLPNCKHIFHVDCVDEWFSSNNTCPICRALAAAEPRVQPGLGHVASQVQPTASPIHEDGDVPQDGNELEKLGCSGLRIASFHRMVIGRERSFRRTLSSDGSAIEDIERH